MSSSKNLTVLITVVSGILAVAFLAVLGAVAVNLEQPAESAGAVLASPPPCAGCKARMDALQGFLFDVESQWPDDRPAATVKMTQITDGC